MGIAIYDGREVVLSEGHKFTFNCKEKIFKTDISVHLNDGEGIVLEGFESGSIPFIYNKTIMYNNGIILKCGGKRSANDIILNDLPMIELSGRWSFKSIKPASRYGVENFIVPIKFRNGYNTYYKIIVGNRENNTAVYFKGLGGKLDFWGDENTKFSQVDAPFEDIYFDTPTKVPLQFYNWLGAGWEG
jgi:hypothetical protein